MSAVYKSRDEQRQKAADEVWMSESAHNKIWQDGAKWADEHPVITANLFKQCAEMLRMCGVVIADDDINYVIKKYKLE